jgi:hypothetical protein
MAAHWVQVLEQLTGQQPVFGKARYTVRTFGIRRNERISTSVTIRGEKALSLIVSPATNPINHRQAEPWALRCPGIRSRLHHSPMLRISDIKAPDGQQIFIN